MDMGVAAAKRLDTLAVDAKAAGLSAEEALKLSEERLNRVLAATRDGLWDSPSEGCRNRLGELEAVECWNLEPVDQTEHQPVL